MAGAHSEGHYEIVDLGPSQAAALTKFFVELRDHGDDQFFHPFALDAASANRVAALRGRDRYLVAVRDGVILAFGMLRGWDSFFEIPSLGIAVRPSERGSRLAHTMMEALHDAAREGGATRVRLTVDRTNGRALGLYRRLGYVFRDEDGARLEGFLELTE